MNKQAEWISYCFSIIFGELEVHSDDDIHSVAEQHAIFARVASDDDRADKSWCILRTGGSRTLPLFRSMAAAGMDVWTPVTVSDKRKGRARVRVEAAAPIMPTFVFARASLIYDLVALESAITSPHPQFSIFRYNGRIVTVKDGELANLRTEEGRAALARRKKEKHIFKPGQPVSVPDGAFAGLSGVVEDGGNGKIALVCFGTMRIKIATFLLKDEGVSEPVTQ